ncbi:hypothetical protein PhCBS80983_g04478 [Powellomyces hirtus]|uniref:SET domain-containing protein n=1 Tax=Powellomyces hirtus TaxID=109895 RepID=A0A507DYR5_9FUNG|nr:hypothetical protein PhCBS80983_g04478 [Powellomyces hirtus]
MQVVRATRTIKKGEEIYLTYTDSLNSYNTKQETLEEKYGFTCELPSLPRGCETHLKDIDPFLGNVRTLPGGADAIVKEAEVLRDALAAHLRRKAVSRTLPTLSCVLINDWLTLTRKNARTPDSTVGLCALGSRMSKNPSEELIVHPDGSWVIMDAKVA